MLADVPVRPIEGPGKRLGHFKPVAVGLAPPVNSDNLPPTRLERLVRNSTHIQSFYGVFQDFGCGGVEVPPRSG